MTRLIRSLFWLSLCFFGWSYLLFPLIALLRGWLRPQPVCRSTADLPFVTMIVVAHDEEALIAACLQHLQAVAYPRDRFEILIASDGSTDATNDLVRRHADTTTRLLVLPRAGKNAALNAAFTAARGEILVFTDADNWLAPDALLALIPPFADPQVGGVAGEYRPDRAFDPQTQQLRRGFLLKRRIREIQARAGSTMPATGQIYAVRRRSLVHLPDGISDDLFISLQPVVHGQRLLFEPRAVAYDLAITRSGTDFQRKVRVMTRALRGMVMLASLLNPFRYGFYALQFATDGLMKRMTLLPALSLFFTALLLWRQGLFYRLLAIGQALFHGLAISAAFRIWRGRPVGLLRRFYTLHVEALAAFVALLNQLRGRTYVTFTTRREPSLPADDTI